VKLPLTMTNLLKKIIFIFIPDVDSLKYIHTDVKTIKNKRKLMEFTNWRSTIEIYWIYLAYYWRTPGNVINDIKI